MNRSRKVTVRRPRAPRLRVSRPLAIARRRKQRVNIPRPLPDSGAGAYKRLLVDPCYGSLTPSPYSGALGGNITRSVGAFSTATSSGVIFFHPNFGTFSSQNNDVTTTNTLSTGNPSAPPGRAIAGCLQATFTGPESSRAGYMACGVVSGAVVFNLLQGSQGGGSTTFTLNQAAAALTSIERTPVDKCEVNWFPANGDEEVCPPLAYSSVQSSAVEISFSATNFVCLVWMGVPASNMLIKLVSVVETTGSTSQGPGGLSGTWSVPASLQPKFLWKDVLGQLSATDSDWYMNTFKKVMALVGGGASAYASMGLPGALGYLVSSVGAPMRGRRNVRAG